MQEFVEKVEINHIAPNKENIKYLNNMEKDYDFTTMYTQFNLIQLLNIKFLAKTGLANDNRKPIYSS